MTAREFRRYRSTAVCTTAPDGQVREDVECPFCECLVATYLWSRSGSGQLCKCGALLAGSGAFEPVKAPS